MPAAGVRAASWARALEGRRVGVALSAGFFGFYAHAGFLKAIEELGIVPAALVAGLRGVGAHSARPKSRRASSHSAAVTSGRVAGDGWLSRPLSALRAMRRGLDVVRNDHARWKIRWAHAVGCRC